MKVVGFWTGHAPEARPGLQIVHHAVLQCGHACGVGHGEIPHHLPCPEGCDDDLDDDENDDDSGEVYG